MSMGLDPVTQAALGFGLQALGTMQRRDAEEETRNRVMQRQNQEAETQAGIARQNAARVSQTAQELSAPKRVEQQQQDETALAEKFTPQAGVTEASYGAQNPGAPKEISDAMAAAVGRAIGKGKAYAKSTAALSALNKGGLNSGIAISRSAQDIGLNNNAAQGSWNVMGQDLNAIRPNQNSMAFADTANGIGGLFATSGLRGMVKPKVNVADLGGSDAWY